MGQLNKERRKKNVSNVTEPLLQFTRIPFLHIHRIILQSLQEQKLPESIPPEESAQAQESDRRQSGFRNLNQFIERDRIVGWISDGDDRDGGDDEGQESEGKVGEELSGGGGVVESAPFEADSEVAKVVGG